MSYPSLAQLESHAQRRSSQIIACVSPRFRWFILTLLLLPLLFLALIRINSTSAQAFVAFGTATPYNVGAGPYWTATFTKFGKPAIAVTNQDGNSVSVLYGNMEGGQFNGTLGAATTYDLVVASVPTPAPQQVVAGNLGQLPLPCLVIAAAGSNRVAVLLGDSDDSFIPAPVYYNVGNFPESVALGDVNGDGNLDIIAANFGSNTISVLLGNSDRTFQAQQTYPTSTSPESVVVADFNNDGKIDVATVSSGNPGKVSVLLNVNGTFPNALTSDVGGNPFSLAVGDFNSDGKVDIVTANHNGGVSVLLNNGVRPFPTAAPAPINAGSAPFSVAVADFNLDGRPDIAVSNSDNGGSVGILPNNNGSFQALQASDRFSSGPNPQFVASGDFNLDGKPDIVAPNHPNPAVNPGTINVLLNTAAFFTTPPDNDNFVSATALPETVSGRVLSSNIGATRESFEPIHAGVFGSRSVWFKWTSPATGGATFDTFASTFDTTLAVYRGTVMSSLVEVARSNNDVGGNGEVRTSSRIRFNASTGTTYLIAVDSGEQDFQGPTAGNITLNWNVLPAPSNDNFADAQPISGPSGNVTVTNAGATKEPSEPNHADNAGGSSIWFRWTAPSSGNFTFNTTSSRINCSSTTPCAYDTLLAIYIGNSFQEISQSPNPLTKSDDDTNPSGGLTSRASFEAVQGTVYKIAVDTKGTGRSDVVLAWLPTTLVFHDTFENPVLISGNFGGSSTDVAPGLTAWFLWTAPNDGSAQFTSSKFSRPSGFTLPVESASQLTAFSVNKDGTLGSQITSNTGSCPGTFGGGIQCNSSTIQFTVSAQRRYAITITKTDPISLGSWSLSWSLPLTPGPSPPPGNDNFENSADISRVQGFLSTANLGATSETGEPAHAGQVGGHSVWYRWTAPGNGNMTFSTDSSFTVAVYVGSPVDQLVAIASGVGSVSFSASVGITYQIALDSQSGGATFLAWEASSPGSNDFFANAIPISQSSGSVIGTNRGATKETGEPNHAGNPGGASVWYRWTAPFTGPVTFYTDDSSFNSLLAIYTGGSVDFLSQVVGGSGQVTFFALTGTIYHVAIDGSFASTGAILLHWGPPQTITGRVSDIRGVGIANIPVTITGDALRQQVTDVNGFFSFSNLMRGGKYTVTPGVQLFNFDFASRTYGPLTLDEPDANFVAQTPTYSIAGQIKVNGVGVDNIPVTLVGTKISGETVLTKEGGNYSFIELPTNGDYKVTPSSPVYTFSADIYPANNFYEYKTLNEAKKGADFTATALPQTLTVASQNPSSGVVIAIAPVDNGLLGGGPTPLTRVYNPGTQVTLTAPPTAGGNNFQKWLRNGADFSTNLSTSVTMDTSQTMTAVYLTPTRTLTVASSNPASGINITVTPADKNNQGNGDTQFTRTYNINQKVTLTAPATNGNNTFQKWLKDGAEVAKSLSTEVTLDADHTMTAVYLTTSAQTPAGQNVSVQLNGVTVNFSNVTTAGTTTIMPISPAEAGQLPSGFQLTGDSTAFDISTTAVVQPPISVCFNVPSVTDATVFGHLRILHGESGVLQDRTSSQNFATKTICATVSSLSPFVLASATVQQLELLLEDSQTPTTQVAALDALLMLRDPFPLVSPGNLLLGVDKNTRVVVLVRNLLPGAPTTVHLIDAQGQAFDLPALDQRLLSDLEFSQVTFRLPDTLASGPCAIEIRASGLVSNFGTIRIK